MRPIFIFLIVCAVVIFIGGFIALIWWLVLSRQPYTIFILDSNGLGDLPNTAGYTKIRNTGDMFWWFYPTISDQPTTKPIILWLDGVTGVPPSLLANFGMFGPYDFNMNRRNLSWIDNYNLLFIDAPIGTGFSTAQNLDAFPKTLDENTNHLSSTIMSFYMVHHEYVDTPLYIFGQGHGAALAVTLATRIAFEATIYNLKPYNLKGIAIGNGIISPGLALTKLGYYLEELAYIDDKGRNAIDTHAKKIEDLVNMESFEEAFDHFLDLEKYVNDHAGAVAINMGHVVEKLKTDTIRDYFGQNQYLQDVLGTESNGYVFMTNNIAPKLGINNEYDVGRKSAIEALKHTFMIPATDKVEYLLEHTNISVAIYNGNLDAVSNTPGQLEWINNLKWYGQENFKSSPRSTLIVNNQIEGYFKKTEQLEFYWMNVAGQFVPLDSPLAMRRVVELITKF